MRRYLVATVVLIAVAAAWIEALPPAAATQPIAFPHARHQTLDCTVCHRGAATAARAGLPEITLCARCHATAPAGTAAVWDGAVAARSISWVQIEHLPDHVLFSHRRHVTLGKIECATCHGPMAERTTPPSTALVSFSMDFCLDCHQQKKVSTACVDCHR